MTAPSGGPAQPQLERSCCLPWQGHAAALRQSQEGPLSLDWLGGGERAIGPRKAFKAVLDCVTHFA